MPHRIEQRRRHVVGRKPDIDPGLQQAGDRRDIVQPVGAEFFAQDVAVLVDIAVGMGRHDHAEIGGFLNLFFVQDIQMADHPALVGDVHDAVYLFEHIEEAGADHGKADIVARRLGHEFDHAVLRHTVIVIKAGPAGIGGGTCAEHGIRIHAGIGEHAADAQPVVAEAPLAEPRGPVLHHGFIFDTLCTAPGRAVDEVGAHGGIARGMDRLIGTDQLLRGAMLFEHAGRRGGIIDPHGFFQAGDPVVMGKARRHVEIAELGDRHERVFADQPGQLA